MAFSQSGNVYNFVANPNAAVHPVLPPKTYAVRQSMFGFFLEDVGPMKQPPKLYGDTQRQATRIIGTFLDRPLNTGVLLTGQKGSGKTLLARTIAQQAQNVHSIPTLVIDQQFEIPHLADFLMCINQPTVILFDEFEKVYDSDHQQAMLSLLDGFFPSKKMFVLTCNDPNRIDNHMINRPGRLFYAIEFDGVQPSFVREYCEDMLHNKDLIESVIMVSVMSDSFSFDALQALVEEMNRYDEKPAQALEMLNVRPEGSQTFDIEVIHFGVEIPLIAQYPETTSDNPFTDPDFNLRYNAQSAYNDLSSYGGKKATPAAIRTMERIVLSQGGTISKNKLKRGTLGVNDGDVAEQPKAAAQGPDFISTDWELTAADIIIRDAEKGIVVYERPDDQLRVTVKRPAPYKFSYSKYV